MGDLGDEATHELPVVIAQPEARRWYARMLIDRDGPGDRDKAREPPTEAVAMYRQIGMPRHAEMPEEMQGELWRAGASCNRPQPRTPICHRGSR